jgi:hypothetical protein
MFDFLIDFPIKESKIAGLLGEIEDHILEKHNYKSKDLVTWARQLP